MRNSRTTPSLLVFAVLFAAGCGSNGETPTVTSPLSPAPLQTTPSAVASGVAVSTDGRIEYRGVFLPWTAGANAVTYDPAAVPAGATAVLATVPTTGGATVKLDLTGMVPRRAYGAHLHTDPCAAAPADAGPHYQHSPDPKAVASPPSVDPAFANPRNEVWLDFTADTAGAATVSATQTWPFDQINPPRSLIVHAEQTKTTAGKAGTAGPRVACLTLPI